MSQDVHNLPAVDNATLGIGTHAMGSWTEDEIKEACTHSAFLESVRDNLRADDGVLSSQQVAQPIERKYYYAGGNARYVYLLLQGNVG